MGQLLILVVFFLYTGLWWFQLYNDDPLRHQTLIVQHIFLAAWLLSQVRR